MIVWKSLSTIRLHQRKLTWKYWTKLFYCIKNLKSQLYIAFFRDTEIDVFVRSCAQVISLKFSELRILERSQVREYSPYRFLFGLFLKATKSTFQDKWRFMVRRWSLPNYFVWKAYRLYYASASHAASRPRVLARLLVGNKKWKWIVSMLKLKNDHSRYNSP